MLRFPSKYKRKSIVNPISLKNGSSARMKWGSTESVKCYIEVTIIKIPINAHNMVYFGYKMVNDNPS